MKSSKQELSTKPIIGSLFGLFLLLFTSVSLAQNRVVVVPLGGDEIDKCLVSSDCDGDEATLTCPSGEVVIACDLPANPFKRVFVTSTIHDGNLGGLDGADAVCQGLADSSALTGQFKAWLPNSTESPSTRFNRSVLPYVLVDGTQIAVDYDDLIDGSIQDTIDLSESGIPVVPVGVWTNTSTDGTPQFTGDGSCSGWLSDANGELGLFGSITSVMSQWTAQQAGACDTERQLYCFEQ